MKNFTHPIACFIFLLAFLFLPCAVYADDSAAPAAEAGRMVFMDENDYYASNDDRNYTQGARVSYLTPPVDSGDMWDAPFNFFSRNLPVFGGDDRKRKYEWTVGQSIFTPANLTSVVPSPGDRPYAAWLYIGTSFLQEIKHENYNTLENAEILGGVVGPAALGGVTQNDWHQFIGVHSAVGWQNQLHNEPGFMLTYERKWRFQQPLIGNFAVDVIPELGATGGNVMTYAEAGGMVRIGQNLAADYGPDRVRPSLSGTAWFDPAQLKGKFGWYFFLGTQGRAVGHSIFLDGNTYSASPSVEKKTLVADFIGGASLFYGSSLRADFTVTQRTKEFYGETGHPERFGGVNLAFSF